MTKNGFEQRVRPYLLSMVKHCTELMALGFKKGDVDLTRIAQDMNTCLQSISIGFDTFFDENDLDLRVALLANLTERLDKRIENIENKIMTVNIKEVTNEQ